MGRKSANPASVPCHYCASGYKKITFFCTAHLWPEMKSIATNCMQEVVSDFPYDLKKMLESRP
jgi:hypothetical protein